MQSEAEGILNPEQSKAHGVSSSFIQAFSQGHLSICGPVDRVQEASGSTNWLRQRLEFKTIGGKSKEGRSHREINSSICVNFPIKAIAGS